MFELIDNYSQNAVIKVIGVGGGGGNAVQSMLESKIYGADFIVANTDAQALDQSQASTKIQLGISLTEGLGAGEDPIVGEQSAIESEIDVKEILKEAESLYITGLLGDEDQ